MTDDGGLQRLCLSVYERWGAIDLAIHCAAHAPPLSPAPHIGEKDFDLAVDVNFKGTKRLVTFLQPLLTVRPGGHFVYVSDARAGQPFFGAYGASKAAADALVRSWAEETVRIAPRVSIFQPEPMPTALRARFYPGEDASKLTPCATEAERLIQTIGLLQSA